LAIDAALSAADVQVNVGALATGWEVVVRLAELGVGLAIVNASVPLPKSIVARRLRELPPVRYQVFTRPRPRADVADLVSALREGSRSGATSHARSTLR
jgi:hypothetical protein